MQIHAVPEATPAHSAPVSIPSVGGSAGHKTLSIAVAALAASWVMVPQKAEADNRVFGAIAAGVGAAIVGGMLLNQRQQRGRPQGQRQQRANNPRQREARESDGTEQVSTRASGGARGNVDSATLAKLAPTTARQMTVLKSIVPAVGLGVAGATLDPTSLRSAETKDHERDYSKQIQTFLAEFRSAREREGVQKGSTDVTLLSLERVIDRQFERSGLQEFSRFQGENWSAERLKVMVLNRARADLRGAFVGARQESSLDQMDAVIEKASATVFRQMFETSELLAANKSSSSFIERLYQKDAGKIGNSQAREELEDDLNRVARGLVEEYERLWQRDENLFALRYRAQRVVFDCLSTDEHIDVVTTDVGGGSGQMPPRDVIRMKLSNSVRAQCAQWLDSQFIEGRQLAEGEAPPATRAAIDARARLAPQRPVALRAIWRANGPQDDASL